MSRWSIETQATRPPGLDPKANARGRRGGRVAMGGSCFSYHWAAAAALDAGASAEELVGTLIAVAPICGLARVVSATTEVALAIGYDIDEAFDALDRDSRG